MTAARVRRVDEVAVVFNGKTPPKSEQRDNGHPVLKIKDVDALGRFRGAFSGHVGAEFARKHVKKQLTGGETLVLNAAHNATHVASKTFYAAREVAGSLATGEWLIVRWSANTVDSRVGNHWINAPDTRFRIRRLVNGIHLYPKDVARLQIPLPPLVEQKRIARILDAADALRDKRREALAQLSTFLRSTFLDMFGDPVTNPLGWDVRELNRTKSKVQIGPFGSLLHKEDYIVDGVPLVNPMHIVSGQIHVGNEQTVSEQKASTLSNYRLQTGDVVMGRRGEMGRCAIVSDAEAGMLCGTGSLFVRPHPDELTSLFLAMTFSSESMKRVLERLSQGVTMPNLNRTMIEGLKVGLPPLDLQYRFAAIVESIKNQKASQRAHLAELDTLFASLQSRAFRGDL